MEIINKINLRQVEPEKQTVEATQPISGKRGKRKFIVLGIVIVFLLWLGLGVVMPAMGVYQSAKKTADQAKKALEATKKQNIILASEELKKTHGDLIITRGKLNPLAYLQFIPLLGTYYQYVIHVI